MKQICVVLILLAFVVGCNQVGRSSKNQTNDTQRQIAEYDARLKTMEEQQKQYDQQAKKMEEQAARYDRLLERWEKQTGRYDAILN